jgi:transcriptional regulator with XRE-family HTH domain
MPQARALIATLKKALKARGLTYREVAKQLDLSESSVKRIFAEENFSLARLDQICQLMGWELSDLVRTMESETRRIGELTEAQEQELVSDYRLLLVAHLVVNGWQYQDILTHFQFPEAQLVRYLVKLDKLRLLELLPHNRIKLLLSPHFVWRRNGPIQRFFTEHLQEDFLKTSFDHRGEAFFFLSGTLSRGASAALIKKMEKLAAEFNDLNREEQGLPLQQRDGCSMILAIRPWRPDVFERMRRVK